MRCAQSAHGLTTSWPSISARYAHDQALSHVASFGIVDSLCDMSVLLFGVWSSRKSHMVKDPDLQELSTYSVLSSLRAGWSHVVLCLHVEADQDTHC